MSTKSPTTTVREQVAQQDFGILHLSRREEADARALRTALDRLAQTGTKRHVLKTAPEVLIYIRRRFAAGLSASAIARELNAYAISGPLGGTWSHITVLGPWRSNVLSLIDAPLLTAARAALPRLQAVLDSDADPERPMLRTADRRALLQALQVLQRL